MAFIKPKGKCNHQCEIFSNLKEQKVIFFKYTWRTYFKECDNDEFGWPAN
jgi:hypothetical protein